jgi:hypothetical protein
MIDPLKTTEYICIVQYLYLKPIELHSLPKCPTQLGQANGNGSHCRGQTAY